MLYSKLEALASKLYPARSRFLGMAILGVVLIVVPGFVIKGLSNPLLTIIAFALICWGWGLFHFTGTFHPTLGSLRDNEIVEISGGVRYFALLFHVAFFLLPFYALFLM